MSSARSDTKKGLGVKRKKNFYKSFAPKRTKFTPFKEGVKGFLVTCNKSENHAVKEAFFLLNKYADELEKVKEQSVKEEPVEGEGDVKPVEVKEEKVTVKEETKETGDVDLEQELKKEVEKMREARKRFWQLTTKLHNVVFIEAKEPSMQPNALTDLLFAEIIANSDFGVKYCLKLLPVLVTCTVFTETIKKTFINLLESQPDEASYYIIPKVRANDSITREEIIKAIGEACEEKRPLWTPDFDNPKLTIVINIVNKICCFSVLENFNVYKKYNPVELTIALGNKVAKMDPNPNKEAEGKKDIKGQSKGGKGGTKAKGRTKGRTSKSK